MLSSSLIITLIVIYFAMLLAIAWWTSRNADTDTFFTGNRQSPWYLVAFGMIGTSISGVTFISVPGKVGVNDFSYFQMILGNMAGYLIIGTVLMPLYYKLNLISIYSYLNDRFGFWSYKTGAFFFLLSRTIGSSLRLYLAAAVLQMFLFERLEVPFLATVVITILLIWIYTFRGGIKTIIWTDSLQTLFLITALVVSVYLISEKLGIGLGTLIHEVAESDYSQIFFWDVKDKNFFGKQFIAGMFITIVMTGLDQDLMQKNLTCKSLKDAQKNMFTFSLIMVVVNLLFLTLGALLYIYCEQMNIAIPAKTDDLFPQLALNNFGVVAGVCFLLGIIASSYASADSALASLTTSFCIDFMEFEGRTEAEKKKIKFWVHVGFSVLLLVAILIFNELNKNNSAVVDAVFSLAGYTYGPLLGLYAYGILTKKSAADSWVPFISVLSPLLTYLIDRNSVFLLNGYKFGFELLLLNGAIVILGLWISGKLAGSKEIAA